jgi:hypothetical protein
MFWRVIVYILVGVFVLYFVLPKLADVIRRYITPSPPDSSEEKPKDRQGKH